VGSSVYPANKRSNQFLNNYDLTVEQYGQIVVRTCMYHSSPVSDYLIDLQCCRCYFVIYHSLLYITTYSGCIPTKDDTVFRCLLKNRSTVIVKISMMYVCDGGAIQKL
jgi:hypothetical protein